MQVIPFYDRSGLIEETLGTLERALSEEVLVTVIVVLALVVNLRGAMLVSGLLPLAVLACFAAMKVFGIDANIVALSGIAIAIGTMVDMGIVISENILKHLEDADAEDDPFGSDLSRYAGGRRCRVDCRADHGGGLFAGLCHARGRGQALCAAGLY